MDTFESAKTHRRSDGSIDVERYCLEARHLRSKAAWTLLTAPDVRAQHRLLDSGAGEPVTEDAGQALS